MINYAVVGVGYFGAELARIMKEQEDAKVVAVYDPENGETIAKELSCDAEQSLEALVSRPDVQCVIVATPNYLHKEPVILAAKHGKNVFCEKPIALSYADCDEMVKACEKNPGKIGGTPLPPHSRTGLCSVHHGRYAGRSDDGSRKCSASG